LIENTVKELLYNKICVLTTNVALAIG